MAKMSPARPLAAALVPLAALCAPAASAQILPGLTTFPCHVVHLTNQSHDTVLVNVSLDPSGTQRIGGTIVNACTSADVALPGNLRCGLTLTVAGDVRDTSKISPELLRMNTAAAVAASPSLGVVKGTVVPQNAAEPGNWLALADAGSGKFAWRPVAANTKMPAGCPSAPVAAPATVAFTFNNITASPVLVTASGNQAVFDHVCIAAGQSRTVQTAPSAAYKVAAQPAQDVKCQQLSGPAVPGVARAVNNRVTMNYVAASYILRQAEPQAQDTWQASPNPTGPGGGTQSTTTLTAPPQPDPNATQSTQSAPPGK